MMRQQQIGRDLKNDGFAIVDGVLSNSEVDNLIAAIEDQQRAATLNRKGSVFAVRNLLEIPAIAALARSEAVQPLVRTALGNSFFPVRGILFDKVPQANWKVPWHQDVTIAVQERIETAGFGPWSMKAEVLHVQPPVNVLERMISVRLHLDPCDDSNGALRVVPGSHRRGRIPEESVPAILSSSREHVCEVSRGGALLMRPLLLHASSAAVKPSHRRVVHLDFASDGLPGGLQWIGESKVLQDGIHEQ